MINIAIFASGSGSNAQNIITFFKNDSTINIVVMTNSSSSYVLKRAESLNVSTIVFDKKQLLSKDGVIKTLQELNIGFIVLAGFLWKLPVIIINHFKKKIVNIHPALLPKYGGKGMYGMFVHSSVVQNKEKESGITIHYVNENYDEGAIIFQAKVEVESIDTPEDVALKIHALEMKHFPVVIKNLVNEND